MGFFNFFSFLCFLARDLSFSIFSFFPCDSSSHEARPCAPCALQSSMQGRALVLEAAVEAAGSLMTAPPQEGCRLPCPFSFALPSCVPVSMWRHHAGNVAMSSNACCSIDAGRDRSENYCKLASNTDTPSDLSPSLFPFQAHLLGQLQQQSLPYHSGWVPSPTLMFCGRRRRPCFRFSSSAHYFLRHTFLTAAFREFRPRRPHSVTGPASNHTSNISTAQIRQGKHKKKYGPDQKPRLFVCRP